MDVAQSIIIRGNSRMLTGGECNKLSPRIAHAAQSRYNTAMSNPHPDHDHLHSEAFLARLMRRQLKLSVACAAAFVIALFGMPLLNYFAPEFMSRRVGGFTMSWLILGVLFFPYVWIIAFVFIKKSIALEDQEAADALRNNPPKS